MSKVYLNLATRTLKNIRSIEMSREATKTFDEPDIYGDQELLFNKKNSMTFNVTVRKGTDDDVLLFDLDMSNAEVPITYKDASGKRGIVAAGARAGVNFQPRTNDATNNEATYEILVTGVGSLAIL